MDRDAAKRELLRLIEEAPKVAPSIAAFDGRTYDKVTDNGLNAQNAQRWTLEASAILQHLAGSGTPVFGRLYSEYFQLESESKAYHSRAIFVHKVTQILQTAIQLLASPVGQLAPVRPSGYAPNMTEGNDAEELVHSEDPRQNAELELPEAVTIPWLVKHVPVTYWIAALGLLGASFLSGIQASRLSIVQDIFGLVAAICNR